MQQQETRKAYPESVVKWGESGSFSLCLRPDGHDAVDLRNIQLELEDEHPEAVLTRDLFLPFFNIEPKPLYEHISQNYALQPNTRTGESPKLDKLSFYKNIASIFGQVIIGHANVNLEAEGIERGEKDSSSVYVKLGRTASFDYLAEKSQRLFDYTLAERVKIQDQDLELLKHDHEFGKIFEVPEPRILIATSLGAAALSQSSWLPETMRFNEIGDGSSALTGPNRRTWYMQPNRL